MKLRQSVPGHAAGLESDFRRVVQQPLVKRHPRRLHRDQDIHRGKSGSAARRKRHRCAAQAVTLEPLRHSPDLERPRGSKNPLEPLRRGVAQPVDDLAVQALAGHGLQPMDFPMKPVRQQLRASGAHKVVRRRVLDLLQDPSPRHASPASGGNGAKTLLRRRIRPMTRCGRSCGQDAGFYTGPAARRTRTKRLTPQAEHGCPMPRLARRAEPDSHTALSGQARDLILFCGDDLPDHRP